MNEIIKKIKSLQLHDSTMVNIAFNSEEDSLEIAFNIWNEVSYDNKSLKFIHVEDFSSDSCDFLSCDEVSSVDVTYDGTCFSIKFIILTGFSKPSISFQFLFTDVNFEC